MHEKWKWKSLSDVQIWDPMDCKVHGILQARLLARVGKPFPSPGNLPNPGIKPRSPALEADSLLARPQGKPIDANDDKIWFINYAQ